MLFLMLGIMSVNATTTVLNSCPVTSLTSNTEYLINFTSYTSNCFYVNSGTIQNVTINGQNMTMKPAGSGYNAFIYVFGGSGYANDWTIKDLSFEKDENNPTYGASYFIYTRDANGMEYSTIDNVKAWGSFDYFHRGQQSSTQPRFRHNTVQNSLFILDEDFSTYANSNPLVDNNTIDSSFIYVRGGSLWDTAQASGTNFNFVDSAVMTNDTSVTYASSKHVFTGSVVKGYPHVDSDNNNVADSDLYVSMTSMAVSVDVGNEFNVIQDFEEGEPFIDSDYSMVTVQSETIGSPDTYELEIFAPTQTKEILDTTSSFIIYDNFNGLEISNAKLDCSLYSSELCYHQDHPSDVVILNNEFKGLIRVSANSLINNIEFSKLNGDINGQMISNLGSVTYNNITISNSNFTRSDDLNKGTLYGNHMIALQTNNLNLHNNTFNVFTTNGTTSYEILRVEGTNPQSNKVYNNYFQSPNEVPPEFHEVFTEHGDTKFYNNYIGLYVNVSNSALTGLNVTPLVYFEHTDGKYYGFYLGNYYLENTACVDGDGDGFCDSSYTSGVITDTRPLASYPFDYSAHLLTADSVIDSTAYNITLIDIVNNQTINLTDLTDDLMFTFQHDSDILDLTCDFIIDGASVDTQTNVPKDTNITHTEGQTWIEKSYTHRVECFSATIEDSFEQSNEVTFIIALSSSGNGNGEGEGDIVGAITGISLFGDSGSDTVENAKSLYDSFSPLIISLIILGSIAIFIGVFVLIWALIGGLFTR